MASFTDNPQVLGSFNPYIQQLPVEQMRVVGQQKQQQYDEGIQKIQSSIDNVAGLDIIKDNQKQYLQSQLNQLGSKLKTVAGGDFSNYQLVNSVGGMVGQISKDPIIQNAVGSTMKIRREQSLMEDAQKNGKSSPNREYDFNRSLDDYLKNPDIKTSFNGQYKEHVDVNKKVLDVIQKLHPNSSIKDMPYAIGTDGKIDYSKISNFLQRQGETGVDEGQIKTAISASLDENDYDELASEGRYSYRNASTEDLQNKATGSYLQTKALYTSKLDELQKKLLVTNDIGTQQSINDSVKYYKSLLGDSSSPGILQESYKNTLQNITANPDAARANLYTRNWLDEQGNGFSYKDVKDEVLTNPLREDFWKQQNFNLDQIKEKDLQKYRGSELGIQQQNANINKKRLGLEEKTFEAKYAPKANPYFEPAGNPTTSSLESLKNYTNYNNALQTTNKSIIGELTNRYSTPINKVNPNDIIKNIEQYKLNNYKPSTAYEKQMFDEYIKNTNTLATNLDVYNTYKSQVYKEITGASSEQDLVNKKLKDISPLNIPLSGGAYTTFSPKEIYNYLVKEQQLSPQIGSPTLMGASSSSPLVDKPSDDQLTNREKIIANLFSNRYKSSSESTGNVAIDNYLKKFSPIISSNREIENQINVKLADKMAPITGTFRPEQAAITFKNETAEKNFISDLSNLAVAEVSKGTNVEGSDNQTITKMIPNIGKTVQSQFVRKGDQYFVQLKDTSSPSSSPQLLPVTSDFVEKNPSLGTSYLNKNLDVAQTFLTNNQSTNIFKDYTHAYYNSGKFGGYDRNGNRTVNLPIAADLENFGGQTYPVFKIKSKDGSTVEYKYPLPTDRVSFENQYLPSLTDDKIISLFKTKGINIENLISK